MRALLATLGLAALALGAAACGSDATTADVDNGKQLFTQACGSCHAFEDAQTAGLPAVAGVPVPSLDDAFRGARADGWRESQFKGVVEQWIERPAAPMPAGLVTGQDASDVAAYVASVAGTSEGSAVRPRVELPPLVPPGGLPEPAPDAPAPPPPAEGGEEQP